VSSFDTFVAEIRSTLSLSWFFMDPPIGSNLYPGAAEDAVAGLQHPSAMHSRLVLRISYTPLSGRYYSVFVTVGPAKTPTLPIGRWGISRCLCQTAKRSCLWSVDLLCLPLSVSRSSGWRDPSRPSFFLHQRFQEFCLRHASQQTQPPFAPRDERKRVPRDVGSRISAMQATRWFNVGPSRHIAAPRDLGRCREHSGHGMAALGWRFSRE
jgi:hypothetical protein